MNSPLFIVFFLTNVKLLPPPLIDTDTIVFTSLNLLVICVTYVCMYTLVSTHHTYICAKTVPNGTRIEIPFIAWHEIKARL